MTSTATRPRPSLRCRVLRRHRWVLRCTEDGNRYVVCVRCGRDRHEWPTGGAEFG